MSGVWKDEVCERMRCEVQLMLHERLAIDAEGALVAHVAQHSGVVPS